MNSAKKAIALGCQKAPLPRRSAVLALVNCIVMCLGKEVMKHEYS